MTKSISQPLNVNNNIKKEITLTITPKQDTTRLKYAVTITGDYIKGKGSPIIELRGTPALEEASATQIDKQD